jgi:hypothetical protein
MPHCQSPANHLVSEERVIGKPPDITLRVVRTTISKHLQIRCEREIYLRLRSTQIFNAIVLNIFYQPGPMMQEVFEHPPLP